MSNVFQDEVKHLWNLQGDTSFSIDWATGLEPIGNDRNGLIWIYKPGYDFREEMLGRIV